MEFFTLADRNSLTCFLSLPSDGILYFIWVVLLWDSCGNSILLETWVGLWRPQESCLGAALSSQTIFSVSWSYLGIPHLPGPSPQLRESLGLHLGSLFGPQSRIFPHEVNLEVLGLTSFVFSQGSLPSLTGVQCVPWEPLSHVCCPVFSCLRMEGKTSHSSPILMWKQKSVNLFFILASY